MKTAIYGAGSLGTVLGAYLARSGVQVDLISRNEAHIAALRSTGAHVTGWDDFSVPVSAYMPCEMPAGYDVIVLMTKCIDNAETVRFLKDKLSPDGIICTCQNGLPEAEIAAIIGSSRTYGCTIGWGATYVSPGCSLLTSGNETFSFTLGKLDGGSDENLEKLRKLFSYMGDAEIDDDFISARWSKLLINASFSAVSAVFGMTFGEAFSDRHVRRIIQSVMKECVDVAHANGIKLAPMQGKNIEIIASYKSELKRRICFILIPLAMRKHRSLRSSMLQDLERGKRTEIDAIDGAVIREGEKKGIAVPVTAEVVNIMHRIEKGELNPSLENLSFFR